MGFITEQTKLPFVSAYCFKLKCYLSDQSLYVEPIKHSLNDGSIIIGQEEESIHWKIATVFVGENYPNGTKSIPKKVIPGCMQNPKPIK